MSKRIKVRKAEKSAGLKGPAAQLPSRDDVPDWSEETLEAFQCLTPMERSFVEYFVSGDNAAEAYRRASGRTYTDRETDTTRIVACQIRAKPRVRHAIDLAMRDMNFDARMDRAWMLQRLEVALERAEASDDPRTQESIARIVRIIAEVKGEIVKKSEVTTSGSEQPANVSTRVDAILAGVAELIARRTGGTAPAIGWSNQGTHGSGDQHPVGTE